MPPAYEVLLLNTSIPQIQAAQSGDTYVCPRDIQITANLDVTGNTILGNASTDTVQVNGYMGVGGAANSQVSIRVTGSSLTGANQYGFQSAIQGNSAATTSINGVYSAVATTAESFTCQNLRGVWIANGAIGAGSAITNKHGLYIDDHTGATNNYGITSLVSSGTDKWNIYASGTAQNYFAGNVGIGNSNPAAFDQVASDDLVIGGGASNHGITIYSATNASGGIAFADGTTTTDQYRGRLQYAHTDDSMRLFTSATERLRIDSSGNLGLGVTPSAWGSNFDTLQVGGGTTGKVALVGRADGFNGLMLGINFYNDNTNNIYIDSGAQATRYRQQQGVHVWETAPSGTAGNAITFTERASIGTTEFVVNNPGEDYDFRVESDTNTHALFVQGSDGFVGIGTSTPAFHIDVLGSGTSGVASVGRFTAIGNGASGRGSKITIGAPGNNSAVDVVEIVGYQNSLSNTANNAAFAINVANTAGTLTERLRITSVGNVSIGGTADRVTTVGTAALNIFNGTAPVGTLADGISIYSSSGEAYVMDAAGNATLFSPHDAETNEWIFKSKHTPTGKVLKIDVEKLLRFVNDHFGLDAIQEFIEE